VITARGLGVSQFGVYTSILAIAIIATDFVGLGAHEVMMRETARNRAAFAAYFGHVLVLTGASLLPIGLLCFGIAAWLIEVPLHPGLLAWALLSEVLLGRVLNHAESIMVAHGDAVRSTAMRLQGAVFRLGAAALYFVVLDRSDLEGWIFTIGVLAVLVVSWCYVYCVRLYGPPRRGFFRHELAPGVLLALPQLAFSVLSNVDRVALALFVPPRDVGAYGAATRAMQVGLFPMQVGTRITYPHFFAAHRRSAREGLRFASKVSVAMLLLGVGSMGLVIGVSYAVPLIFGKDFSSAQPILMVLALSMPLIGLVTPPADVLTALDRQNLRAACYLVVALGFIGPAIVAARFHGTLGVAWTYVGAVALLALAQWISLLVLVRREGRA
jgi:O-antigen/teichoic acid export membrane protein